MVMMLILAAVPCKSSANTGMVFNITQTTTEIDCNSDANVASLLKSTGYVIYESNVAPLAKVYYINTYTRKDLDGVKRKYYAAPDPMLFTSIKATINGKMAWVLSYDDSYTHALYTGPEKTLKAFGQKVSFPMNFTGYALWHQEDSGITLLYSAAVTLKFNATETTYAFMHGNNGSVTRDYLIQKLRDKGYVPDNL